MREKANLPLAILPIFASLSPVASRVQPALKNTMRVLTVIPFAAAAFAKLRTNGAGIMVPPRIPSPSFLAGMSKRAVSPVVAPAPVAFTDLKLVHPEVIRRVRV